MASRWLNKLPLTLSVMLFALCSAYFYGQIGDDSYIYFRYVDRALAGEWWSWSNHIPPVEGYSSPFWYLLLVVSGKLGVAVETAARAWGIVFAFVALLGCYRLALLLGASEFLAGVAALLLSINHGFQFWASSGLETSFYAALYVWACIGIIREKFWLLPVALIGVARPEGAILLLALLLCIALVKKPNPRLLLLCLLPTVAWLAWRLHLYGVPLANTYYAKASGDALVQIHHGLIYSLPVLIPLLACWIAWFTQRTQALMITLGMICLLLGIVVIGGGDWMFHFRLLVPVMALMLAAAVALVSMLSVWWQRGLMVLALSPLLLLSLQGEHWRPMLMLKPMDVVHYQEGNMTHASILLAEEIRKRYPDKKLIAVNHAGALPWALPEYDFIDMAGLNDAHIAQAKGTVHKKYDVDYVLSLQPDLFVLNTRVKPGTDGQWYHKGYWPGEDALMDNPQFVAEYQPTDIVYEWEWVLPMPQKMAYGRTHITAWILVYERR